MFFMMRNSGLSRLSEFRVCVAKTIEMNGKLSEAGSTVDLEDDFDFFLRDDDAGGSGGFFLFPAMMTH